MTPNERTRGIFRKVFSPEMKNLSFLILLALNLSGCRPADPSTPPKNSPTPQRKSPTSPPPVEDVLINGTKITSQDGSKMVNGYHAEWKSNIYCLLVTPRPKVIHAESALRGILKMVRESPPALPKKQFYKFTSSKWPKGCSVHGVTRGANLLDFTQGQFILYTPDRTLSVEIFAKDTPILESAMNDFFDEVKIDGPAFTFPEDPGTGKRTDTPLHPDASELP